MFREGGPSSVQALRSDHPLFPTLAEIPIAGDVPFHSIVGDLGDGSDGVVTLESALLEGAESPLKRAAAYFASQGVELALSPAAARRIAAEAATQPRLGARAIAEVFRRVIRDHEFEPAQRAREGVVVIDLPEVEAALTPGGTA